MSDLFFLGEASNYEFKEISAGLPFIVVLASFLHSFSQSDITLLEQEARKYSAGDSSRFLWAQCFGVQLTLRTG